MKVKYKKEIYGVPFNIPTNVGDEYKYVKEAFRNRYLAGGGYFTKKCQEWMRKKFSLNMSLLTHSCTGALDMSAILSDVEDGDEVIMPSFTFVSTANAFVLRSATPVFVDIREDTLNIDEKLIENAITKKTKAIVVVHYAGVGCEMDAITKIAKKHNLILIEDNAQGFYAKYKNKYLGTFGDMSAISFHETKNLSSGEGGALWINKQKYIERAEIIWEKGTNRNKFYRGEIDKYTWVDVGSSFLPSELVSACLWAQLKSAREVTIKRINDWNLYYKGFEDLEKEGVLQRPNIPSYCEHNGHIFYILLENQKVRSKLIDYLKDNGILSVFHYIPLHSSPAGKKYCRINGNLPVTDDISIRLLRLPLYYGLRKYEIMRTIHMVKKFVK